MHGPHAGCCAQALDANNAVAQADAGGAVMNRDEPPSTDQTSEVPCDESEVARVFDAYLAHLEAGRPVVPARLLADHPDIAAQRRPCLDVMPLADQMARGGAAAPAEPRTASHSPAPGTSRVVSLTTSL